VLPRGEAAAAQDATVDGDAGGAEAGPDDTPAHVLPTAKCDYCNNGEGSLFRCQRCGDAVCHAECCRVGVDSLGAACSAVHLCGNCVAVAAEAAGLEAEQHSAAVIAAIERLTSDEQSLLKRMNVAGRGARAAAVITAHAAALDTLSAAAGLEDNGRLADVQLRLGVLLAAELLRGATPDHVAAVAAVDAVRHLAEFAVGPATHADDTQPEGGVVPIQAAHMLGQIDAVLSLFASNALPSTKLRALQIFRPNEVEEQLRSFLTDATLPILNVVLPGDLARRLRIQAEAAEGGEVPPSKPPKQWRDRARRLVESVSTLAINATIGNKNSMPNFKMLQRLVAKFGREPRPLSELRSRLRWAPSHGPEDAWLRERTLRTHCEQRELQASGSSNGGVLLQSSDNASLHKMTQPGLGLTERVTLCSWTALGWTRLHSAGGKGRDGRELPRHVARHLATNEDSPLLGLAQAEQWPFRPLILIVRTTKENKRCQLIWPTRGRSLTRTTQTLAVMMMTRVTMSMMGPWSQSLTFPGCRTRMRIS